MSFDYSSLQETIANHERFLIVSHKSPDGDAVGSSVAWFHFLKNNHKEVKIILPDSPSEVLLPFIGGSDCYFFNEDPAYAFECSKEAQVLFCLDFNTASRVGAEMQVLIENFEGPSVMIDHHPQPDDFTSIQISDIQNSSTCQLLFECLEGLNALDHLTLPAAKALYLGIMTDTGSFRYPSVTAKTHRAIVHFMDMGLNHAEIHEQFSDRNRLDQIKLKGFAVAERFNMHPKFPMAFIALSQEDLRRFNYQAGDTEGLVNVILSIEGIQVAILIQEKTDGIKMSFRSKGDYFVNELAKNHFSGGGHKYAAGGASNDDMQTTISRINDHIHEVFK